MKLTILMLLGAGVIAIAASTLAADRDVPGSLTTALTGLLSGAFALGVILVVRWKRRRIQLDR